MRLIIAIALLAFAAPGFGAEYFIEPGQCRFTLERDGTFYQSDLQTDNFMHPGCLALGVRAKWRGSDRLGWSASFLASNSIEARDNIALNDEQRHVRGNCTPPDESGCYSRFNGHGETYGVRVGLTYDQPLRYHVSLGAEMGLFFFQHHFKAEGRFIDPAWGPDGGRKISYNETSRIWDTPSPYLGISVRYRDVALAVRKYWPSEHRPLSLTNHGMVQLSTIFFY